MGLPGCRLTRGLASPVNVIVAATAEVVACLVGRLNRSGPPLGSRLNRGWASPIYFTFANLGSELEEGRKQPLCVGAFSPSTQLLVQGGSGFKGRGALAPGIVGCLAGPRSYGRSLPQPLDTLRPGVKGPAQVAEPQ